MYNGDATGHEKRTLITMEEMNTAIILVHKNKSNRTSITTDSILKLITKILSSNITDEI